MTNKEQNMLLHYKYLIENRLFDEYDIYGFLILIRNNVPITFDLIIELGDTMAHKNNKNKGRAFESIKNSRNNNFQLNKKGKVRDYKGISSKEWNQKWTELLKYYNIKINDLILLELKICTISLLQGTLFVKDKQNYGEMAIQTNMSTNQLSLVTTGSKYFAIDGRKQYDNVAVAFTTIEDVKIKQEINFFECSILETYRENGILKLKNENGLICEII